MDTLLNLQAAFGLAYIGMGIHRQIFSKRFVDKVKDLFGFSRKLYPHKAHTTTRKAFLIAGSVTLGMTLVLRIFMWPAFLAYEIREEG